MFNPFRKQTATEFAISEKETAQRKYLEHQAAAEYHQKMAEYYQRTATRLSNYTQQSKANGY